MKRILLLFYLMFSFTRSNAQILLPSAKQEAGLIAYNVGFGALTAGIGAVINKPKGAKWHKHFVKGILQGSMGGALSYGGKRLNSFIASEKQLGFGWPAKIMHSAGTSIIYGAALNKPLFSYWSIDYGPLRADFNLKEDQKVLVRFMPWSIFSFVAAPQYGKFDILTTLYTGTFSYKTREPFQAGKNLAAGISLDHSFVYITKYDKYGTIAHELNHVFQFRDYLVLNTWIEPLARIAKRNSAINKVNRWIYLDMPWFRGAYGIANFGRSNKPGCYYSQFFEFEAEKLTDNVYVERCK